MTHGVLLLAIAGVAALALMAALILAPYSHIAKRGRGWGMLMFGTIATLFGGTKPKPTVYHDNYLTVAAHFSLETNIVDNVTNYTATGLCVSWMLSDAELVPIIPTSAPIYIEATADAGTNYTQIGQSTLGAGSWEDEFENGTNYQYFVWLDMAPDAPVATNGVYHLDLSQPVPNRYVPLRIKVEVDGETITPSAEDGL